MTNNDLLSQTVKPDDTPKKHQISFLGIVFTVLLAIVLIVLGERVLFDLNRGLNPYVEKTTTINRYDSYSLPTTMMRTEYSPLSDKVIYYQTTNESPYWSYKVLIQAGFIIPVFLLTFLLYYLINIKRQDSNFRIVSYGYLIFSIWMVLHLIINLIKLAYREFPELALYLVLIVLAIIFTTLAIFIQKKVNQHRQS